MVTIAIILFIGGGILALKFARDFKKYDNEMLSEDENQNYSKHDPRNQSKTFIQDGPGKFVG